MVLLILMSQELPDRVAQAVWGHLVQAIIKRNDIYIYIYTYIDRYTHVYLMQASLSGKQRVSMDTSCLNV